MTKTIPDVIWQPPPYVVEELYDQDSARAFAESIPKHVSQKGGVELRDRFGRGAGVKIAVLDTGVSKWHVEQGDLQHAFKEAKDFSGSSRSWEDVNGHGSHCAGIIAADNDQVGTSSILDRCELYVGKVLGDSGTGSSNAIAAGIDWAVEMGCHIISMSLGGGYSEATHQAGIRAERKGILIVAAAGNSGYNSRRSTVIYPAKNNDAFLACASIDFEHRRSSFSSVGPSVDFTDYGSGVYSTYRGDGYASLSGTSMATPNLAAVCGVFKALEVKHTGSVVSRTLSEYISFLRKYVQDLSDGGKDPYTGWGFINLPRLVEEYEAELQQPTPEPPPDGEWRDIRVRVNQEIPVGDYLWTKNEGTQDDLAFGDCS